MKRERWVWVRRRGVVSHAGVRTSVTYCVNGDGNVDSSDIASFQRVSGGP